MAAQHVSNDGNHSPAARTNGEEVRPTSQTNEEGGVAHRFRQDTRAGLWFHADQKTNDRRAALGNARVRGFGRSEAVIAREWGSGRVLALFGSLAGMWQRMARVRRCRPGPGACKSSTVNDKDEREKNEQNRTEIATVSVESCSH